MENVWHNETIDVDGDYLTMATSFAFGQKSAGPTRMPTSITSGLSPPALPRRRAIRPWLRREAPTTSAKAAA